MVCTARLVKPLVKPPNKATVVADRRADKRPNGPLSITSFVFSAAVSASEGINIIRNTPSILDTLQENVRTIRAVLDRIDAVTIPSVVSPITTSPSTATPSPSATAAKTPNPATAASRDALTFDIAGEERLLQDIVDEVPHRARGSHTLVGCVDRSLSSRGRASASLSRRHCRKECERAASVIKAAVAKVLARRK